MKSCKSAVTSVYRLALVLLAACSGFLHELLAGLGECIAEITAAAEAHLLERVLDVRVNDHDKKGKKE